MNELEDNGKLDIRFMVDHMLIKLGKYLRILGYDAEWDKTVRTHELIKRANVEGRVFLTRNSRLPDQYPVPDRVITLSSIDPVEQLSEVVSQLKLDTKSFLFSKCVRCNVVLDSVEDKKEIESLVHPNVYRRYEKFYRCPSCRTVFWKGSHIRNTCKKLGMSLALLLCTLLFLAGISCKGSDELLDRLGMPTQGQFVYDYARVLNQGQWSSLQGLLNELSRRTDATVVVVVTPSLDGGEVADLANRLYEKWGIGKKGQDKGVLLLAALQDRKIRIEVGYGLEGILPDAKVGRILDETVIPAFREKRFAEGVMGGSYSIAKIVAEDAGVSLSAGQPIRVQSRQQRGSALLGLLFLIIFIPILIRHPFLALFLLSSGMRGSGFSGGGFGGGFGGFGGGLSGGGGASRSW